MCIIEFHHFYSSCCVCFSLFLYYYFCLFVQSRHAEMRGAKLEMQDSDKIAFGFIIFAIIGWILSLCVAGFVVYREFCGPTGTQCDTSPQISHAETQQFDELNTHSFHSVNSSSSVYVQYLVISSIRLLHYIHKSENSSLPLCSEFLFNVVYTCRYTIFCQLSSYTTVTISVLRQHS